MEKNTLIGFAMIGAVLIGFSLLNRPSAEQLAQSQRYQDSILTIQQQQANKEIAEAAMAQTQVAATALDSTSLLFNAKQGEESFITLQNELVELQFTNKGGRVYSAKLKDYNGQDGKPVVLFDGKDAGMNFSFNGKNENR